jgi:hypothetical protein
MRLITTLLAGLLLASVGIGPAQAVAPSVVVLPAKATLLADGSVQITMRVRCNDQQQAFEWSIGISQGTNFGNDSAGPAPELITCDGRFQKVEALVQGESGPYAAGPAEVQASVQVFDEVQGSDIELADQEVVRLRP